MGPGDMDKETKQIVDQKMEIIELRLKNQLDKLQGSMDASAMMNSQTLTEVLKVKTSLHGDEKEEGFIGKTNTALAVQKKTTNTLWWLTGLSISGILGVAFFIIRSGLPST